MNFMWELLPGQNLYVHYSARKQGAQYGENGAGGYAAGENLCYNGEKTVEKLHGEGKPCSVFFSAS